MCDTMQCVTYTWHPTLETQLLTAKKGDEKYDKKEKYHENY